MDRNKHHSDGPRRRLILVATGVVVVGAYVWHRRVLGSTMSAAAELYNNDVSEAFEEGVRYGLNIAKEIGLVATKEMLEKAS